MFNFVYKIGNIYQDVNAPNDADASDLMSDLSLRQWNEFELSKILDSKSLEFFKQVQRRPYDVNCRNLIEWNEDEVRKAKRILFKLNNLNSGAARKNISVDPDVNELFSIPLLGDENFIFPESKCRLFRELRGYHR